MYVDHGKVELVAVCSGADSVYAMVSPFGLLPMARANSDTWRCRVPVASVAAVRYYAQYGRLLIRLGGEAQSVMPPMRPVSSNDGEGAGGDMHPQDPITPVDLNGAGSPVRSLDCMELWGGNGAVDQRVAVPGIDAWVFSQPCCSDAVGGDVHYVSMCGCAEISRFALADATGHGDVAARAARSLRRLLRRFINTADQTRLAEDLNRRFSRLTRNGAFATAVLLTYFPPTDQLLICNAGHPHPLRFDAQRGVWARLSADPADSHASNLPLGIVGGERFEQHAVTLGPGDIVVVFSDGLTEARGEDGTLLGEAGVIDLLDQTRCDDPATFGRRLLDRLTIRCPGDRGDDLSIFILYHTAADAEKPSLGRRMRGMARMLGLTG